MSVLRASAPIVLSAGLGLLVPAGASGAMSVDLVPSLPSGQSVGTPVSWQATVMGGPAAPVYRFLVRVDGGPWRIVKDFSWSSQLRWTPTEEGEYAIGVVAGNPQRLSFAFAAKPFTVHPLALSDPVVVSTPHPLVALYSAPPCQGGDLRVHFREASGVVWRHTSWTPCRPGKSLNVYVAGLKPSTAYVLLSELVSNFGTETVLGPPLDFTTGVPDIVLPDHATTPPDPVTLGSGAPVLLTSLLLDLESEAAVVATDLDGNVIWYYRTPNLPEGRGTMLLRPLPGGTMLVLDVDPDNPFRVLREVDLAGNALWETSPVAVNWRLLGRGDDLIREFHHEALRLPNGHTLVLGYVERFLTDVQGPGTVAVVGDIIIDLDRDLRPVWTWNAFDHLDPSMMAVLDEKCDFDGPACFTRTAPEGNDWTHSNSIDYVEGEGNLLLSIRHLDWVVKIDYRDGQGTGDVLWRLGEGGDFSVDSSDPWPWFSHAHDAELEDGLLVLFDNGNTRRVALGWGSSRGQVWRLDESTLEAELVLNVDLGGYSPFLGSAEKLPNGSYHFLSGGLSPPDGPPSFSHSIEVLPDGTATYLAEWSALAYRSFRLRSLYEP